MFFLKLAYGAFQKVSKAALLTSLLFSPAMASERVDILAFGDSLTAGYGLMDHEGLVPQLTAWLKEKGHDVRIINAGVSGDTTAGGLERLEWSLTNDIDAMILELGANDMLRAIDPAVTRENIAKMLEIAKSHNIKVLLIGLTAPSNYGPEWKTEFERIWPDTSAQFGTLLMPDFFNAFAGMDLATASAFLQPDGLHPNADGVAKVVEALGPQVEALIGQVAR